MVRVEGVRCDVRWGARCVQTSRRVAAVRLRLRLEAAEKS